MELNTKHLTVTLRSPDEGPFSQRFDTCAVVRQVVLHGKHRFCRPEQLLPGRVTCNGLGLCGEFAWDGLAAEAAPGQPFPKLGVGLLTQRPEGGPYDMWKHYEARPYPTRWRQEADRVTFTQTLTPCLGVAGVLTKELRAEENTLTLTATLENTGARPWDLWEYQHNFVAIDELPVGPGYRLELPLDGAIAQIADAAHHLPDRSVPAPGVLRARGQTVVWDQPMENREYHKVTEGEKLLRCPDFAWRLSHADSPAAVSETVRFTPARLVLWGLAHCVCAEVYAHWQVAPGASETFVRMWRFTDEAIS